MHLDLYSKFLMKFLFLLELTNRSVKKKKKVFGSDIMGTPGLM